MDYSTCKPVAVTPLHNPFESYLGYLLRVSAANILQSPSVLVRHSGASEYEIRTLDFPREAFAAILARKPDFLANIDYRSETSGNIVIKGKAFPSEFFRKKSPRICPECILEKGYIPSEWDLTNVQVCHVHKKYLISHCPSCKQKIRWIRPGLLKCACENSLANVRGAPAPEHLTDLVAVLWAVINNQQLSDQDSNSGMPLSGLTKMTLNTLLGLIHLLGIKGKTYNHKYRAIKSATPPDIEFEKASEVLMEWPTKFIQFLNLNSNSCLNNRKHARNEFELFYGYMIANGFPEEEVSFIRTDFFNYIDGNDFQQSTRFNSNSEYYLNRDNQKLDLSNALNFNDNGALKFIEAAQLVGLPLTRLTLLLDQKIIELKYRTLNKDSISVPDIHSFNSLFINQAKRNSNQSCADPIKISDIQTKTIKSKSLFVDIIKKVISGELAVYGDSSKMGDLTVSSNDVELIDSQIEGAVTGMITIAEAAKVIGCQVEFIDSLIDAKHIEAKEINGFIFCRQSDVVNFTSQYLPLHYLVKLCKLYKKVILSVCQENNIQLLKVTIKKTIHAYFFNKSDLEKIEQLIETYKINRSPKIVPNGIRNPYRLNHLNLMAIH